MNYRYHPEARVESVKTFERYESEQEGLGSRFVEALDATIERIMNDPESYAFIASETRSLSVVGSRIRSCIESNVSLKRS